ncbi:protein kinase [Actinosynnema sp. NPDC047251]|uniref:non-specific serine/threonine protein kinase n=1 Tax=Saccharothrix espanaensis (strain ATCC 51144 / DSM 44229 / JCM 9112 / NBRC 15066 / NRRL 15764) TaxID=1179773 RepID=K0KBZ4_SACES|nr:serine/threonine-protein kinase [Saccharothrix espanaensis]CCH35057.1 Serine/threonine protein kinase [Saccharothrix espanaensis DSM 44229]
MTDDGRLVAGRYRLGHRIGSGAMGIVWQAHDERLHRTVAVKQLLLQPGLAEADTDEAKRRAMREGRIAARLQHPHAIAVYDVAEDDGQPWLVMEYLPSKSLSTVLSERGTLPPRDVASIGSQVASALAAAHIAGIVHRDIKPGNVLLGNEGTVKITDFGISRATGDVTVTATGMLAGTPAYLAPEVAKGYDPGPPSDVFSLGSTLYAAIEGMPPFGLNENTIALLHQVASGKVTPPKQAGPLTALLMRLLRAEPEDRPTMAEAKEALAAVAAGRAAPEFPVALPQTHPPSWQGAPVQQQAAATRSHAPAPAATRVAPPVSTPPRPANALPPPQRPAAAPRRDPKPPGRGPMKSKRSTVVTALAIAAAAVVGILLASMLTNGKANDQAGQTTTVTQPAAGGEPSVSTTKKASTPPPKITTDPTPQQQEQAIRDYFALMPGNVEDGFNRLTAEMKNGNGGFEGYKGWWSQIKSIELDSVKINEPYAYEIEITYTLKAGSVSRERKLIVLKWENQGLFIAKDQSLGKA